MGDAYEVTKKPRGLDMDSLPVVPFVPMGAVPQGGAYEPDYALRSPGEIRSGTYFERGDALIAKITPSFENGKQALATELPARFGFATTEVIPLRPREEGQDRRLLFFYLLHPDVRHHVAERMEGTTGRQRVPTEVLLNLPFPRFEPEEQTAIADPLEMIQRLKAFETQSIQTTQSLKRATMQTLFTHGLRGEAQKETEIGPVPESWEITTINDVAVATQYGLSMRGRTSGTYPILRMNCQEDGKVHYRDIQFVDLDAESYDRFRVKPGDLLFNRTNSIDLVGRMAIIDEDRPAVFASYLVRVVVDAGRCIPEFLNYFMNWPRTQGEIKKLASRAVGQANINATKLRTVLFPLPAIDEQRSIVAVLDSVDRKIDLHRRKQMILEELFKTLLHKLMTGEVRARELDPLSFHRASNRTNGR
ncbi:MAG: restriction endonuclease subunit S [Chloroflexi bacterium]|nr:restriction endonuclease subunit S [Chloroflexota bacterium]